MIVVMKPNATAGEIGAVIARVQELGLTPHPIYGEEHTVVAIVGNERKIDKELFEVMPGVEKTMVVMHPFKLASRTSKPEDTVIALNGVKIGGRKLTIMAGPCSVESRSQVLETAWAVKEAGATILRGGAFKPRSSPGRHRPRAVARAGAKSAAQTGNLRVLPRCWPVAAATHR